MKVGKIYYKNSFENKISHSKPKQHFTKSQKECLTILYGGFIMFNNYKQNNYKHD